jgi:hypothetical protein
MIKNAIQQVVLLMVALLAHAASAFAEWTPLINADDFSGIQADVMTVSGGIISVVLIIVGISYLVRALVK